MANPTMRLYVVQDGNASGSDDEAGVLSFDLPTSNGNLAPHQFITGSSTDLVTPQSVALGPAADIFATQSGYPAAVYKVAQFNPSANGNAAPNQVISTKSQGVDAWSVAVDGNGNAWIVGSSYSGGNCTSRYYSGAILKYGKKPSGGFTLANTIAGAKTGLSCPRTIALDNQGNIWVGNEGAGTSGAGSSIEEFASSASGNVKPTTTITGSATRLAQPNQVTIDSSSYGSGRILVSDDAKGRVFVFAPGSSGNVSPTAAISSVLFPTGVATDGSGHIYVSSFGDNSIQEFARNATGGATPILTIKGSNTDLLRPNNLYLRTL